jgi:hypothetical protein
MGRADKERLARDAAGVGPHVPQGVRLYRISELRDWQIASGEPDIRGWDVRTISGREIGTVKDLLVDPSRGEVVLLDIDLAGQDRHTLAPIRAAQLDRARETVHLDSADVEQGIPSLSRSVAGDDEMRLFGDGYRRAYGERGWDSDRDFVVGHGDRDLHFRRRNAPLGQAPRPGEDPEWTDREVRIEAASEEGRSINQQLNGISGIRYQGNRAD